MADNLPISGSSIPEDFGVDVLAEGGDVILAVRGELDVLTAPVLWERIESALPAVTGRLVLDLADLRFIDSVGLGVIVRTQARLRSSAPERQVVLRNLNAHARKVFGITGLDKVLDVEA